MPHKILSPLHQTLWVLKQLHHNGNPEHYLNFRCIHNGQPYKDAEGKLQHPSEPTLDMFVKLRDVQKAWNESLLNQLNFQNFFSQKPANVYYAINPLLERGHKKEHFAYFVAFYLDMDESRNYSLQARWAQIFFLSKLGFKPSFVVASGHGYHVYWVLTRPVPREEGEAILKRMVAMSGCREGGNTFDISRVFRLPGFLNVKKWYADDKPACALIVPEHTPENLATFTADQYAPEHFYNFPPASEKDLERYYQEARKLSAADPTQFENKVALVLTGALQAVQQQQETANAVTAGAAVAAQNQAIATATDNHSQFLLRFNTVPMADEIKWKSGESWMKKYAKLGREGMTQGELDALQQKHNWKDMSSSELDFKVIYSLILKGYTKDAVRDFWLRPAHRLHRPDKEQKNPDYFDMSFEKALEYAKAAREQAAKSSSNGAEKIKVEHYQTFLLNGEEQEVIVTAALKLNEVYINEDADVPNERELYDVDITYVDESAPEGTRTQNMIIPHSAFCELKDFRKLCNDMFCCLSPSTTPLQHLIRWLRRSYRGAKTRPFHSKVIFKEDRYIFPQFTITAQGIVKNDSAAMNSKITKKIPLLDHFAINFDPPEKIAEQLKAHWFDTLNVHLPRVVASTLGFIAAGAVAPLFEQVLCKQQFHIPTLNLRGPSSTAKSETIKHLCTFAGIKYGANVHSIKSSDFALTQLISATNYLPIALDEFKEEEGNAQNIANVRQLFRRMYSGEAIVKGRRDLSIVTTQIHGGLIIIGELALERSGNISEITRILPINSDGYSPDDPGNYARWKRIREISWCELGPLFYQWILRQSPGELYKQYEQLAVDVEELIKNSFAGEKYRVASNLAVTWFGCRLIDQFIKTLWPDAPTIETVCNPKESLVRYMCEWAKDSGHSMKYTITRELPAPADGSPAPAPVEEVHTVSANELLTVLKHYGMMIETNDKIIRDLDNADQIHHHEVGNQLYIPFHVMYNAVNLFYRQHDWPAMPTLSKLLALINYAKANHDVWIVKHNYTVSVRNRHFRALVLNVKMLRQMGVWPAKAFLGQDTSKPPVTGQNQEESAE